MLLKQGYKNLILINTATESNPLDKLIQRGRFRPVMKQLSGDPRWAARIRFYNGKTVIHFLSRGLTAVPHLSIKDMGGTPVLKDIGSLIEDNKLKYEINTAKINLSALAVMSPELGEGSRIAGILKSVPGYSILDLNLEGVKIYAVAQTSK